MKVKKIAFFQGITHAFGEKNANYLVYLDLVKIRLEIMLGDFAEKKETFLTIKNTIIQTQKKSHFLMLLTKKCLFFSLFTIDQKKTGNKAWRLCRKKRNLFSL